MADDKKKKDDKKKDAAPKKPAAAQAPKEAKAKGERPTKGDAGPKTEGRPHAPKKKPRLATFYLEKVRPALMERFKYSSPMQAPRFEKIVVNMGVGDALTDGKLLDLAAAELGQITGQKPSIRKAKKSIANFKLREGVPIGCMVTLGGARGDEL